MKIGDLKRIYCVSVNGNRKHFGSKSNVISYKEYESCLVSVIDRVELRSGYVKVFFDCSCCGDNFSLTVNG